LKKIAVIGAGIAGISCARTLVQAGHFVHLFEKSQGFGGRMATRSTAWGTFDHGAPYFEVNDDRFRKALSFALSRIASWRDFSERATIAIPGMSALASHWALPFLKQPSNQHRLSLETVVTKFEPEFLNPKKWQISSTHHDIQQETFDDFDAVIIAIPSTQAAKLLAASGLSKMQTTIAPIQMSPCWTLMIGFGPDFNSDESELAAHIKSVYVHDNCLAWIGSETTKEGRRGNPRFTVHANSAWSHKNLEASPDFVRHQMLYAFKQATGFTQSPEFEQTHLWRFAHTVKPLGKSFLWDRRKSIGVCGDWCRGTTVQDAFLSGIELGMHFAKSNHF
jgi:renalase